MGKSELDTDASRPNTTTRTEIRRKGKDGGKFDEVAASSDNVRLEDATVSVAEEKRIMRRIDLRLVLTIGVMYSVSLMDRINLSAANIAG